MGGEGKWGVVRDKSKEGLIFSPVGWYYLTLLMHGSEILGSVVTQFEQNVLSHSLAFYPLSFSFLRSQLFCLAACTLAFFPPFL